MAESHDEIRALQAELETEQARIASLEAALAIMRTELDDVHKVLRIHQQAHDDVRSHLSSHDRDLEVRAAMDWIAQATLSTEPLVSVILPTRDRATRLPVAIQSVLDQRYQRLELIVVDDGSVDGTPEVLRSIADPRVRTLQSGGRGACAARNAALDVVAGDIVAYVDDDNRMHPDWLHSVVWAFEQQPTVDVVYGAIVMDDPARVRQQGSGDMPRLFFRRYDHEVLVEDNLADIGAIAHRPMLAQARFDESIHEVGDWDLLMRLTQDKPPLALPAIACFYSTDAPDRLSRGIGPRPEMSWVREKNRR